MTRFLRHNSIPRETGYSVIDEQMVIRGELSTEGTIRIDGRLEGTTHRAGIAIIGSHGVVVGDLEAREVIIGGTLEGNVAAEARIEVLGSATIRGNIRANAMLLQEGATVHGHITVDHQLGQLEVAEVDDTPPLEIGRKRAVQALPG